MAKIYNQQSLTQMREVQQVDNNKKQSNQAINKKQKDQSANQWTRMQQPIILYIVSIIAISLSTIDVAVTTDRASRLGQSADVIVTHRIYSDCSRIIVSIISGWYLCGVKKMVMVFFLPDQATIFALSNVSIQVMFPLSYTLKFGGATTNYQICYYFLSPIAELAVIANFKIMLKTCKWNKIQVLILKTILYCSCLYYLIFGIYRTINKLDSKRYCTECHNYGLCQTSCTVKAENCCYDNQNLLAKTTEKFSQLLLMSTGIGLAYFSKLISMLSDADGTQELQIHYTVGLDDQNIQQNNLILNPPSYNSEQPIANQATLQQYN